MPPERATFLVDGFNLYYSILDAIADSHGSSLKWLDLRSLCQALTREFLGRRATLEHVVYFSAPKSHRLADDPDIVNRHLNYVEALQSRGVQIEMARFKRKDMFCPHCKKNYDQYEEKETDVAIAAQLFEVLVRDTCDIAVLISGDTDLIPAIRTAQRLFPKKAIWVGFPHKRFSIELRNVANGSFKIKMKRYGQFQLPNPLPVGGGHVLNKPPTW